MLNRLQLLQRGAAAFAVAAVPGLKRLAELPPESVEPSTTPIRQMVMTGGGPLDGRLLEYDYPCKEVSCPTIDLRHETFGTATYKRTGRLTEHGEAIFAYTGTRW